MTNMSINFEDIESICRICLQCTKQSTVARSMEHNVTCEFSSIYSSVTVSSKSISLMDIITMCLSHTLFDDMRFPQIICNLCVRQLTECYKLKCQIQQSEDLLWKVVSNHLFMGLKDEFVDNEPLINECISTKDIFVSDQNFKQSNAGHEIIAQNTSQVTTSIDMENESIKTESKQKLPRATLSAIKPTFNCFICSKRFSSTSLLEMHMISLHTVRNDLNVYKPHQCDECPKNYTTMANLVLHRAIHTGIKFICEICQRGFHKKTSLSTHMSIHTGIRKHLCTICNRSFTSANILQQHKRTHSEVRRYSCSVCSKGFHTSNDLRVHFRSHSGEKPYLCSNCGRRFSRVTHLNIHWRTHSGEKPYVCQQCPKAFAQSGDLKAHERIHNGEKPYPCRLCDRRFNQSSGLRSHMKSHTGERNYICFCGKSFTQSSSLTRHGKLHQNNKPTESKN